MATFEYSVVVDADSVADADRVMQKCLLRGEDYGFRYQIATVTRDGRAWRHLGQRV